MSMFTDPSRPHQVFPLLKAKAKETEWLCRALTFVLPQFSGQADQCHRHISRVLVALGVLRHCCKRRSIHHKTLTNALSMLARCNWFSTWPETTGARRWNTVMKRHCEDMWRSRPSGSTQACRHLRG